MESRTVYVPAPAIARLRIQAQTDLPAVSRGEEIDAPFISDGDVLTAWFSRAVASSLPRPRPISIVHALNARFRLPELIKAPGVYVQNMAVGAFAFLTADVAAGGVGAIALTNREHLVEQATEPQVRAFLRKLKEEKGADPALVLCGEADALLMPLTNWTRAGFWEAAKFGPAVLRQGEGGEGRRNPPGTLVYQHAQSMRQGAGVRNVVSLRRAILQQQPFRP